MVLLVPSLLWLTVIVQLQYTMQDRLPREDHLRLSTPRGSEVSDVGSGCQQSGGTNSSTCNATACCGGSAEHEGDGVTSSGDGASSSQLFEPRDHPNWQLFEHEQCGASLSDRIIGGEKADLGAFPWIARIGYTNERVKKPIFRCGAALVSKYYLITAAHCLTELPNQLKVSLLRLGEHDTSTDPDCQSGFCSDPVVDYHPAEIIMHPEYDLCTFKNDVALIRTDREVEFTQWVRPICVIAGPLMNMSFIGEHPHVAGWGIYDLDKLKQSVVLLTLQLPVVENSQCVEAFRQQADVDDTQMCAGGSVGRDTCGGDSGGPLMLPDDSLGGPPRYFLIGIVSFGASRCGATSKPGVYTRVSAFMQWIMEHMHP